MCVCVCFFFWGGASPKLFHCHSTPPLQCIVPTQYVFLQSAFYPRCRCVLVTLEIVLPTIRAGRPNWAPLLLQQDDATLSRPANTCPSSDNSINSCYSCRRPQVQEHTYLAKPAQVMSPHHSDQMCTRSQVSKITLLWSSLMEVCR